MGFETSLAGQMVWVLCVVFGPHVVSKPLPIYLGHYEIYICVNRMIDDSDLSIYYPKNIADSLKVDLTLLSSSENMTYSLENGLFFAEQGTFSRVL